MKGYMFMSKKRGFVTIATGAEEYYKLAASLYLSYKKFGSGKTPFALICDKENEYSALFDDVVLIQDFRRSTIDKLLMYHSPYEESIFLDADILILNAIDDLWDIFSKGDDVGVFGCTYPADSRRGWFTYDGCGKYKSQVHFMIDMNGGIVYFRKSDRAESIFSTAFRLVEEYSDFDFKRFKEPADEPVMALSMVLHDCHPVDFSYNQIIIPGMKKRVTTDYEGNIYIGRKKVQAKLIHFSNIRTKHFLYNYLNYLVWNTDRTQKTYWKIKFQYALIDGKFELLHVMGAVLRKMGFDQLVERIKKIIK